MLWLSILTYLGSWALLEKLPIVQKFPAFYGTRSLQNYRCENLKSCIISTLHRGEYRPCLCQEGQTHTLHFIWLRTDPYFYGCLVVPLYPPLGPVKASKLWRKERVKESVFPPENRLALLRPGLLYVPNQKNWYTKELTQWYKIILYLISPVVTIYTTCVNMLNLCILFAECICVNRVVLSINNYCLSKQL
jgi:hypothetical protein